MNGITLDAGALIALERQVKHVRLLLRRAKTDGVKVHVPAGALAQAWRNHPRQHALHVFLAEDHVGIVPLDHKAAFAAGALCAATATRDVVDASVALCAKVHGDTVVTSDPEDIATLDPDLELFLV